MNKPITIRPSDLLLLALLLMAATNAGVDTTSTQTLSNKTMDGLVYNHDLTILDVNPETTSFTVSHREHQVTTGSSNVTATLQSASGSKKVRDVCKFDAGTGHVVITRAGGDIIIYAGGSSSATRTLLTRGDCDTLQDVASGVWLARGNGTT